MISTIKSLLKFVDKSGQGLEYYVPVMRAGMPRSGLTYDQALNVIINTILLNFE